MKTVYTDKHKLRDAKIEIHEGGLVAPFECPRRAEIILERIMETGLGEVVAPEDFGLDPVLAVHDEGFVEFLRTCADEWAAAGFGGEAIANCWPTRTMNSPHIPRFIEGKIGYYALACETTISVGTYEAALASKDVALTATALVMNGERAAFGLCRPPGHHAASDQFGGYCFLNNAAIAAQYARDNGARRVALIDLDFHHGNGTQQIFYDRADVLFLSIHGDPMDAFPHFLGHADETGTAAGQGFNVNFPLPPDTPYAVWKECLDQALARIADYAPDLLIVSLGLDTYEHDPISFFKLQSEDYTDCGRRLAGLGLPTVFVLEGGYAVEEVGVNTVNVLQGFDEAAH
ncbi:histone deacetylase family protein [Thalassorhabdomicrobium marinisediminis]|uniref:histone deacetylase family protein n=1 Tax=Thalassorhabdomicrobium marinisediminis TaxID=2170577 RepID=UPI00248F7C58|nr:histone deacetylase family protein [Thalassorhabdomicrobium marinisediminis]